MKREGGHFEGVKEGVNPEIEALSNTIEIAAAKLPSERLKRIPTPNIHSNDERYGEVINQVSEQSVKSDLFRVGLVIGTGGIISSLKRIPAEMVLIVDANPFILE